MNNQRTVTLPLEDWDMIQTVVRGAHVDIGHTLTSEDMHPEDRQMNIEAGHRLVRIMDTIQLQTGVAP